MLGPRAVPTAFCQQPLHFLPPHVTRGPGGHPIGRAPACSGSLSARLFRVIESAFYCAIKLGSWPSYAPQLKRHQEPIHRVGPGRATLARPGHSCCCSKRVGSTLAILAIPD